MADRDFLRNVEVFKGLPDGPLNRLVNHCREINYRQKDKLFTYVPPKDWRMSNSGGARKLISEGHVI